LAYTAAPLAIVVVLLGLTFVTTQKLTDVSDRPDLAVEVIGFQWQWQFEYRDRRIEVNGDDDTSPQLWLPVGRVVRFTSSSPDVIHSFWVPDFLEKRDVLPGTANVIEVRVKEPGQWIGRCAEYCGLYHWSMRFSVCAVAPEAFDAWATETAARPQPVIAGPRIDGRGYAPGMRECPSAPTSDIGYSPGRDR
jgi:cytochrome c oxidase subunit 2